MTRIPSITAALVAFLSSTSAFAGPGDRVAVIDSPPGVPVIVEPRAILASLQRTRDDVAAMARWLAPDLSPLRGLTEGFGDRLSGALGDAIDDLTQQGWLTRLAPALPTPPDLTALTTVPVSNHTTSGYGWRDDPIRHRPQFHAGADIKAAHGTSVYAAGVATVILAKRQSGYGNVIYLDHGNGIITRYGHLSKILVKAGETVDPTTEIGRVGATGRATGPHLHFEVRIDGRPVNPVLALQVGDLERRDPDLARLVGLGLAPDVQSHWINDEDPPRGHAKAKHRGSRPERPGRKPRDRNHS